MTPLTQNLTKAGKLTDQDNVTLLHGCLKGKARNAVETLFASQNSAKDIMSCLEARFGSNQMILTQVVNEIKVLPHCFTDFATNLKNVFADDRSVLYNLKNGVQTIRGLSDTSYLYNTDLANEVKKKIPNSMLSNYIICTQTVREDKSNLEKLADFLFNKTQTFLASGVIVPKLSKKNKSRYGRTSGCPHNE